MSRSPTFGLCSSYAIGPERHVIAEGYMTRKLNFCLKPTLILILTLILLTAGILTLNDRHGAFESFCAGILRLYTELLSFELRNFRTPRHFVFLLSGNRSANMTFYIEISFLGSCVILLLGSGFKSCVVLFFVFSNI